MNKLQRSTSRHEAIESLMFVSGYVYRLLHAEANALGIRWTALMVLKDLDLLGPTSQRLLAEIEQVKEPTMTVLIRQMLDSDWICRRTDANDGRIKLVVITPKGKRTLAKAGKILRQKLSETLADLTERQKLAVGSSLRPLVDALALSIVEHREGTALHD